jgi:RimJ/RimL family protein N-acetyltransferase
VPVLTTKFLSLAPLTLALVRRRLAAEEFTLDVEEIGPVSFQSHWPGDALGMFATFAGGADDPVPHTYVAIESSTLQAVGLLGGTSEVDEAGSIEIGYGFGVPGRGFATEAVDALVSHFLSAAGIRAITANTAVGNIASQRVLQKNGFRQTGTSKNEDDGDLLVWIRD